MSELPFVQKNATLAWRRLLARIFQAAIGGESAIAPRNLPTLEVLHSTVAFDMHEPAIVSTLRKPSYRFMAAEALWVMSGSDRVAQIAPYNAAMRRYSDDGETFFGAYGPRFLDQLPYVARALARDPATRQAAMTFWRPSPPETRDVPCTVALTFNLRQANDGPRLNCHAFMRSSDTWLGVPYDFFTFSMLAAYVLHRFRLEAPPSYAAVPRLGALYFTAVSSHLYENHEEAARAVLRAPVEYAAPSDLRERLSTPEPTFFWPLIRELAAARDGNFRPFVRQI